MNILSHLNTFLSNSSSIVQINNKANYLGSPLLSDVLYRETASLVEIIADFSYQLARSLLKYIFEKRMKNLEILKTVRITIMSKIPENALLLPFLVNLLIKEPSIRIVILKNTSAMLIVSSAFLNMINMILVSNP